MHYFLFPQKDATIYEDQIHQNTGLDQILEIEKQLIHAQGDVPYNSRILIQFDLSDFSASLASGETSGSDMKYYLNLYTAEAVEIPIDYTLYVYPVSQSWEMGNGKRGNIPITKTGVSWNVRDGVTISGVTGSEWNVTGSDFISGSGYEASQSFSFQTSDLHVDVTTMVEAWLSGSLTNYGFLIKRSATDETSVLNHGSIQFFSNETHTIFRPRLEIIWKDFSYNPYVTSSLSQSISSSAAANTQTTNPILSYTTITSYTGSGIGTGSGYFTQSGDPNTWYSESYGFVTQSIWSYTSSLGLYHSSSVSYVYTTASFDTWTSASITWISGNLGRVGTLSDFYTASLGSEYKTTVPLGTETYFLSESMTDLVNSVKLSNGNVFVAYSSNTTGYISSQVYDQDGNQIKSGSEFDVTSGTALQSASILLSNDNKVYMDISSKQFALGRPGYIVEYDATGSYLSSSIQTTPSIFSTPRYIIELSSGGKFGFETYATDLFTIFSIRITIFDETFSQVTSSYHNNNDAGSDLYGDLIQLSNNNVMTFWQDVNLSGSVKLYDVSGSALSNKIIYHSASTSYPSAVQLANGNVLVAYRDVDNSNYGTFQILTSNGSGSIGETIFDSNAVSLIKTTLLSTNEVLISYKDNTNSQGAFVVYDQNANKIIDKNIFSSNDVRNFDVTLLNNGNVFFSFVDVATSSGSFNRWLWVDTRYYSTSSITSSNATWSYNSTTGVYTSQSLVAVTASYTWSSSSLSSSISSSETTTSLMTPLTSEDFVVWIPNLYEEYRQNSKIRFRVKVRDRYPRKNFVTQSWSYTRNENFLPTQSYYAIRDGWNEVEWIPFSAYTQLSVDTTGSFFDLHLNGLEPESLYRIMFKVVQGGIERTIDNNYMFRIIR